MRTASRPGGALASPKPTPLVCVYSTDGRPLPRITPAAADYLCSRGWARWVGQRSKRHLRMTVEVPEIPRGRGDGTRQIRAAGIARPDGKPSAYERGQLLGQAKSHREHILAGG